MLNHTIKSLCYYNPPKYVNGRETHSFRWVDEIIAGFEYLDSIFAQDELNNKQDF